MSTRHLELPDALERDARELVRREGLPVEELAANALAQMVAQCRAVDALRERAARGRGEDFAAMLALVPDVPPMPGDELPPGRVKS